ncbi:hypothetical protein V6N13_110348 [Hibiscus sabdariffa]
MGSWCMLLRYEPARFIVSWWLPHPGVWCQGPLRWLVSAARDWWVLSLYAPLWLALAARTYGSPGPVSWHVSILLCAALCTWWILRCFLRKPFRFSLMAVLSRTRAHHGVLAMVCFFGLLDLAHRGLSRTWWLLALPRLDSWMYSSAPMGLWCMVVCCDPAQFFALWWLPHPGVQSQGPQCCQRPLRCQGWLVRADRAFGLGCFGPCHGWRFPTHLGFPFPVAWCTSSRSRAALRVLRCLSRKSPSCFLLLFLQASTAAASVPAPAASDAATSVPVSAPVGPAPFDAPVASGCTTVVSAPLPTLSTHAKGWTTLLTRPRTL